MSAPVVIVQARMTSARLPGKVLMNLAGRPMLAHTLDRLARCRRVGDVIVATSDQSSDDPVAEFARTYGVGCFRGSLHDVAARMSAAARWVGAPAFVRISGDSPFVDSTIVDQATGVYVDGDCDLVTNVSPRTYPKGMSVEIVRTAALERACAKGLNPAQCEHVTGYFYDNPAEFTIVSITRAPPLDAYVFTVDDATDFGRAEALIAMMTADRASYGHEQLVEFYDRAMRPI